MIIVSRRQHVIYHLQHEAIFTYPWSNSDTSGSETFPTVQEHATYRLSLSLFQTKVS